jgi:osmotically-inducible protein OsmY
MEDASRSIMSYPPDAHDGAAPKPASEADSPFGQTTEDQKGASKRRTLDAEEQALLKRVRDALDLGGVDLEGVVIEVEHDRVIARGYVSEELALTLIPELVRQVQGVSEVDDQLLFTPPGAPD